MEIMAFLTISNLLSSFFLLLAPFLLFSIAKKYFKSEENLPPGPRPWPIIGNIHQMGRSPHVSTAIFAQKYGSLISLRLGTQLLVVASSPEAAEEILKTQDRLFSGRKEPESFNHHFLPLYFVWASECTEKWKSLRTLCRTELVSTKALESQSGLREKKLAQMIDFLCNKQGEVVTIQEVVFTTMFNTLSNIFFGKDLLDLKGDHGAAVGLKANFFKILEDGIAPNISDFYPKLRRFDLQGLRKGNLKHMEVVFHVWEDIIKERRSKLKSSTMVDKKYFLDRLLENEFTDDHINVLMLELFIAGTDSTTSIIEWAMAELLKNKEAFSKVQDELKSEFKSKIITEPQLSRLPYLNACIKETLRLHPGRPLLLPRRASEACEVMNYTIPRNTQIMINTWAINRDPHIWEDPLSFKPERFINSDVEFKGQNFEFLPFGSRRRICPGLPIGLITVQNVLASLILRFDWVLPKDGDPTSLDMSEKFVGSLQKEKPLQLIFKYQE